LGIYRYLVGDLMSNTIIEEIPFSEISYSHVLNRAGNFNASIGLRHPKATRANLDPGRTAVYVERDGVIIWGGILWTAKAALDADNEEPTLKVAGEGFWSYFHRRHIRAYKEYLAVDQFTIAQNLLAYAQAQGGGDLGVTIGAETSGKLRDRIWRHYERKNIGAAIEELAAVQDGFDFAIDVAYDSGGTIVKTFRPSYPQRGRFTSIVFELGGNIEGLAQEVDATRQAHLVDALGAGEGDTMLIATSVDLTLVPPYPLLETIVAYKDVSSMATLQLHAAAQLTEQVRPAQRVPTLLAHAGPDTTVGSFITGDYVTVRAEDGWIEVADETVRIVEYEVAVDEDGRESVALGLAPVAVFS
jgi:hypothetical protein